MRNAHSSTKRRRIAGHGLAALGLVFCAGLAATPAQAANEFKNGFEDQLGRLVAVEAFEVGRFILWGGQPGYTTHYVHVERPYRDRHGHRHWKHHRKHRRHHYGRHERCDHGRHERHHARRGRRHH